MSHLIEAIFWLVLSLLMVFCCIMDVIGQNWFAFIACVIAFVLDIIEAADEFSTWAREEGRKAAQKKENENDT